MQATSALEGNVWSPLGAGCFTSGRDSVPIVHEGGWTLRLVRTDKGSLASPGFDPRAVQPAANRYTHYSYPTRPSGLKKQKAGEII